MKAEDPYFQPFFFASLWQMYREQYGDYVY